MKSNNKILFLAILFVNIISIHAFKSTFINKTNAPILIGIRLDELNAPRDTKLVEAGSKPTVLSQLKDFPSIKWSLCLKKADFIKNPTKEQQKQAKDSD